MDKNERLLTGKQQKVLAQKTWEQSKTYPELIMDAQDAKTREATAREILDEIEKGQIIHYIDEAYKTSHLWIPKELFDSLKSRFIKEG